ELGKVARAAAGDCHHVKIEHDRCGIIGGSLRQEPLDDEKARALEHWRTDILQGCDDTRVVPSLQQARQEIDISADGNAGENVAANAPHAIGDAKRLKVKLRTGNDVRAVK